MSKYVENWWVEELPNGVMHLLINCTQREIYFHASSDYEFLIAGTEEEYYNFESDCVLSVSSFLPAEKAWMWLQTSMKNKDQLSYYYIPYQREWTKNRKVMAKSKNKL